MSFIVGDRVVAYPRPGLRVEGFVTGIVWGLDGEISVMVNAAGPFSEEVVRLADGSS